LAIRFAPAHHRLERVGELRTDSGCGVRSEDGGEEDAERDNEGGERGDRRRDRVAIVG
jgi:hypothetical protein